MYYKVIERKDPRNQEGQGKYYGYIVNTGEVDIEDLAERIAASCTVTRPDVLAVLAALQEQIIYALQEGKRIALGDIGRFRVVANGVGCNTREDYSPDYMTNLRVRFTPNTALKDALDLNNRRFPLERATFSTSDEDDDEDGNI